MNKLKRTISVFLVFALLLTAVPTGCFLVSATQDRTANFYKDYETSNDPGQYMVNIALAQLNRSQSSMGYSEAWCANFVSDCARLAGQSDAIPAHSFVPTLWSNIIRAGGHEVYDRRAGDIIFYDCPRCDTDGDGHSLEHVGIVIDGTYSVEGNYSSSVKKVSSFTDSAGHTTGSGVIKRRYLRPNYTSSTVTVKEGIYVFHIAKNPDRVLDIQDNSTTRGAKILLYDECYNQMQKFRVVNMGDYYCIQNVWNNLWLDIEYPYDEDGCRIQLWDSNTSTEQKWVFEDAGSGKYYVRSLYGEYLDTGSGGPTDNRTSVVTWHYDGTESQQWILEWVSPYERTEVAEGIYTFHNYRDQSKVMDIASNSMENRANIQLFDDENAAYQRFRVKKVTDTGTSNPSYYMIQSVYNGYWLDIAGSDGASGNNIQLFSENYNKEEHWVFEDAGNGKVLIRNLYGTYVDLDLGLTDNHTNIQAWKYDGSTSMEWVMHRVYTVSYDANGGSGAPAEQAKQSDISLTLSSTKPSRTGYTFARWNTKANGSGTSYASGATYTGNADITLYAKWTANAYTVKFNGNGATSGSMSDQAFTYDVAQNLTANAFARKYTVTYNYNGATGGNSASTATATATFNGWATTASGAKAYDDKQSVKNLVTSGSKTLYANWTLGTVTLPTPTKTGYDFGGWYTDSALTTSAGAAGASFKPTTNVMLYAKWTEASLTKIAVKTNPTKTSYYVGDTLNTAGLTLTATYSDGSTKTISSGFTCSPTALNTAGTQTIAVTYSGKTATFTVTVNTDAVKSIAVKTNPTKTSYYVGETLNTAGLTLTATYNSGKTETVSSGFTCSPTALNTAGTQTITVTYSGKTATFNVTVNTDAVKSIAVKTNPTKTSYYVGDTLNTAGLTLTATYNSGKTETVSSGFTCSPTALNTAGTQTITVTYSGKTATFNVTVNTDAVKSIAVKTNPTKTSYYVGDTLNTAGLTLTATYNSGKTETVSSGFTCSPTTLKTAGTQTITVSYSGKTTTFTVTVNTDAVKSIAVKTNPTKTSYYVGDTLNTSGLTLTATYNSGKTETVSSGFTCSPMVLNTAGTQTITVTYSGKNTTFNVTVNTDAVKSIAVKTNPTKTSYYVGDTLNTSGLTLTATYNSGKTETVSSGFTCSPTTLNTAGQQTITVTYSGKTTTFTVTVNTDTVKSIAVKTNPTKTSYYVGDTLNTSGLTLTATYNSGKTETVSSGFTCSPTALNTAGTQTITVTYSGKTTTFTVTVNTDTVKSIAVKTNPTKTSYYVGDTLNTSGLTLTATYNSGKTETVSSGFTCSPTALNTAGTQTITVTYSGKNTTFSVIVQNKEIPEDAPRMTLSKEKARAGDRVDITLSIDNNPGIVATSINLTYDNTKLRLVEVKDGGLLGTTSFSPGNDLTAVPYTVVWEDGLATKNHTANGILATFTFEVLEDAPLGETTITLNYIKNSTFNVNLNEVEFALANGSIEVTDRTPGDVNKDGVVDLKDVVILRRFLSGGWNVTIDEANSDVNGDHVVDLKDTVILRRYLSGGWDVTLK